MLKLWRKSLMVRLVASFLFLSVLTVGLVVAATYYHASQLLEQSVFERLRTAATFKEDSLNLWVDERRQDVQALARSAQVQRQAKTLLKAGQNTTASEDAQTAYTLLSERLKTLVLGKLDLQEIFILSDAGQIILSTHPEHEGESHATARYFVQGQGATFVQTVYPAPDTGLPLMTVATPLFTPSGEPLGVIAAHLNLDYMDKIILERAGLGETGETYLIDGSYKFVSGERFGREAFGTVVHSEGIDAALQGLDGEGLYRNYAGVPVIGVYRWMEDREMALLAEMEQDEALAPARRLAGTILLIGLLSTLALAAGVYLLVRQVTHPILTIADTAAQVAAGDLERTVPVLTQDEIGVLAQAFNQMIQRVRDLLGTLEQRVAARTRDLQIAADVSKQITTELNIDDLLQQVVTLTTRGFHLYGSFIFLLDKDTQLLKRVVGSDAQGHIVTTENSMLIPLDADPSVIALAARSREAVIVNDVSQSSIYLPEPTLPDTRAEIAIPMIRGDRLLGVFDVQSESADRFGQEDLRVLTTLAEQISTAVRNAQLFTEIQDARQAAEASSRAKSVFLSTVSHEMRTPLTSVLGFAKIIKKRLDDIIFPVVIGDQNELEHSTRKVQRAVHQINDNLDVIIAEGERLKQLINDVLDLAEIEAGRIEWHMEPVAIQTVIERALAATTPLFEGATLQLSVQLQTEMPLVIGDYDRLTQVVVNLLSNAVKFTDEGEITCRAWHADDEVLVSVMDSGIGIAPEDYAKLFEKFVQVSDTLTDKPQGTGLGLPICKGIIEHHRGRIWAESRVGVGSTFTFALPVLPDIELSS